MVRRVYTEDDVAEAILDITDRGLSPTEAAQRRGVPRSTIYRRLSGQASRKESTPPPPPPPNQRISTSQEVLLVRWLLRQESLGYALTHSQLRSCVETLLRPQGDNKPLGKNWTARFIKHHSKLSTRLGKRQEAARFDGVAPKAVNWYFGIRKNEYGWIKPENTDEWMATCFLNNIYCCYLPTHCSHGLQPLDNGNFNVIKGAYLKELQKLASLSGSAPVDKVNFIRAYAKAREAGMRKEIILSGWRFTGNWPINRYKALTHPEIQPDKEKLLEEFKTPSPPQLHSDDMPKTSRQVREMAKHRSLPTRRKYMAVQNERIAGLEVQVAQVRRGRKRKAVPNPNRRFMTLAEALAAGEGLLGSKEVEIDVDVDGEVESVIEVGVRSEDESDDFMVVTKHCQRTRSGREVKKPRRE
ncbi:hypothetical protein FOFC_18136 [Fusarium oxysporum]|nr:hypothetical protein FOFC_18136 [Fusarium oxysporum]